MIAFIVRRLLYMIPVLAGILAITLFLFFVVAEDPVLQYAGQNPTEAQLRALRDRYDLEAPAFLPFDWIEGEDLLESKRRERLEAATAAINAAVASQLIPEDHPDAFDPLDFLAKWDRDAKLAGREAEINADLAALAALAPDDVEAEVAIPRVDFDAIELTPEERAEVAERSIWDTQFFRVARFDFAPSMQYEESIWALIERKAPISLSITIPMFLIGLAVELTLSLFAASRHGRPTDGFVTVLAVLAMSVPFLSYIILGQWLAAETGIFPVSGWEPGLAGIKYLAFPILIGVIAGLGSAVRFYRAVLIEEMDRDYVRTARAKGVRRRDVLYIHVLRNAGIPIVTRLSVIIPFLITGSLLIERLFEIPGLGDLMLSGITARDFWVVMPLTYLLAVVYSITVLITDVVYALIDPRVRVS